MSGRKNGDYEGYHEKRFIQHVGILLVA
jgi:hypothetical protein